MPHYSEHINLLILPTDACNMNCVYCFHKPYTQNFDRIKFATVEHLLDITTPHYKHINIIWHGGEPLLMGLDFYKNVLSLQGKYDCTIKNSMQSNLTLLTPEIADFLVENDINISGSFDGTCNELTRGRSKEILAGRQLIIERGKRCGLIMVVSGYNIEQLIENYEYFNGIGVNFSLNLYLEQRGSIKTKTTLNEEHTIQKLTELFDYWAYDTNSNIHISYFKNILEFILLKKKSLCSYTSCLGRWIGVHCDGTLTPCNRYFPKDYNYGNVNDYLDIGDAFNSKGFSKLLRDAIQRREKCKSCAIYDYCCGGCNNVALNENGIIKNNGLSCKILKSVYKHVKDFISNMDTENIQRKKYNPLLLKMMK